MGGNANFRKKAHRAFDPRNNSIPVFDNWLLATPSLHGHEMLDKFPSENFLDSRCPPRRWKDGSGGGLYEDDEGGGLEDDLDRSVRSTSRIAGVWMEKRIWSGLGK